MVLQIRHEGASGEARTPVDHRHQQVHALGPADREARTRGVADRKRGDRLCAKRGGGACRVGRRHRGPRRRVDCLRWNPLQSPSADERDRGPSVVLRIHGLHGDVRLRTGGRGGSRVPSIPGLQQVFRFFRRGGRPGPVVCVPCRARWRQRPGMHEATGRRAVRGVLSRRAGENPSNRGGRHREEGHFRQDSQHVMGGWQRGSARGCGTCDAT
mmetsp:Transcript_1193/g.7807  ORF Transcript_1193/g.7807 Transcript_1193/m.7807 type:complete len:213 (-) Transcript_1193:2065-2703(-)